MPEPQMNVVMLPMGQLHNDEKLNCRGLVLPLACMTLKDQIQREGLLHPIHVRRYSEKRKQKTGKEFQIVCGYRRYTAGTMLGWKNIPCVVHEDMTDVEARLMNLGENIGRDDLNILQEANAVKGLLEAGLTQQEIGSRLGRSRGWAQTRIQVLELPEPIQQMAGRGELTYDQIREIHNLPDLQLQFDEAKKIKEALDSGRKIKPKPKSGGTSPFTKKPRDRTEIFEMMQHFYDYIEPDFTTRVMAWIAGEISTLDLLKDFKAYLRDEKGIHYEIPPEVMPEMPVRTYASTDSQG